MVMTDVASESATLVAEVGNTHLSFFFSINLNTELDNSHTVNIFSKLNSAALLPTSCKCLASIPIHLLEKKNNLPLWRGE